MFKDNVSFNKTENINYKKGTKNDVQKAFGVFNPGNWYDEAREIIR